MTMPRPILAGVATFLLSAAVAAAVIVGIEQQRVQFAHVAAANLAGNYAHTLQQTIERSISSTYALAALVRQGNGTIPEFELIASQLLPYYAGTTLQLAPGGVVRKIVPLTGNEGAIGHDLLADPRRNKEALLAIQSGEITLAGPFTLKQGGIGAVARLPVYLVGKGGRKVFWGFVNAMFRFPDILKPARLDRLRSDGYAYELWRRSPDTGNKLIIAASSGGAPENPVDQIIRVPNGQWLLSIAPATGWGGSTRRLIYGVLGMLFSIMSGAIAGFWAKTLENEKSLEEKVLLRTGELEKEIVVRRNAEQELERHKEGLELQIAERTSQLQELFQEEQAILETLPLGLFILNNRIISRCNPALEAMFGVPPGSLTGSSTRRLFENEELFEQFGRVVYAQVSRQGSFAGEIPYVRQNGEKFWALVHGRGATPEHAIFAIADITGQKRKQEELEETLSRIKTLEGFISICMYCKKIRNEQQLWEKLESYLSKHTDARFSHGICPECCEAQMRHYDNEV